VILASLFYCLLETQKQWPKRILSSAVDVNHQLLFFFFFKAAFILRPNHCKTARMFFPLWFVIYAFEMHLE